MNNIWVWLRHSQNKVRKQKQVVKEVETGLNEENGVRTCHLQDYSQVQEDSSLKNSFQDKNQNKRRII